MASEVRHHVAVSLGLSERELVHRLEVDRRQVQVLFGAANGPFQALQVVGAFGVAEEQREE